jgi:hypothetical protein
MTLAQERQNIVSEFPLPLVVDGPCLKRSGTHPEGGVAGGTVESTGTDP